MGGFGRIAQIPAFHEQGGAIGFSKHPVTGRFHPAIDTPRDGRQVAFNARGQLPRALSIVVHFRPVNATAAGIVEMDGDENRFPARISLARAFVQG